MTTAAFSAPWERNPSPEDADKARAFDKLMEWAESQEERHIVEAGYLARLAQRFHKLAARGEL